jgi:hypothetical protein
LSHLIGRSHRGSALEQAMNVINDTRSTLEKHMPLLLGLLVALLAGKALKKMFWTIFGMYMALHYSGIHPFG